MAPLVQLALDASSWTQYDQPLPPALASRLQALALPGSTAADLRCAVLDVDAKPTALPLLGKLAALLARKGERAVDAGDATGWRAIEHALELTRDPPAQLYVWFVATPPFVLERATALARRHPPPPELRGALVAAAEHAVLSRATLCAGIDEELMAHASFQFLGHVGALRDAFVDRWGQELAGAYDNPPARRRLPSYAVWQAYRAAWQAFSARCRAASPGAAHRETQPRFEAVRDRDPRLYELADAALSRADLHARARGDLDAFRAALGTL